jgi:hypothetical protein
MPRIDGPDKFYEHKEAERVAALFQTGDPEWDYRVVTSARWAWIDVYDEAGRLVASKV